MKNYYDNRAQSFTRDHFDSLMLEIAYRYNIPELELLNFYGAKKIREFKKSHQSLFVR